MIRPSIAARVVFACWAVSFGTFASARHAFAAEQNASSPGTYAASPLSGTVDVQTGGARAHVPLLLPAPRGVSLSLALTYRGQSGTREAGDDWGLDLPAIERKNVSGPPRYTSDPPIGGRLDANAVDHFSFGGIPLVPICSVAQGGCPENETMPTWALDGGGWHYFRAEYEGAFLRFFWSPEGKTWRVEHPSGETEEYGLPLEPTVYAQDEGVERDPNASQSIFRWRLVRRYHRVNGAARNAVVFVWNAPNAQGLRLLGDIYDTPKVGHEGILCDYAHWTHFEWQAHDFPIVSHAPIWRAVPDKRLARIDVMSRTFLDAPLEATRRYHLTYVTDHHRSRLTHVQMEGRCDKPARALEKTSGSTRTCEPPAPSDCPILPAATILYTHEGTSQGFVEVGTSPGNLTHEPSTFAAFDLNADAVSDFIEGPVFFRDQGVERQFLYFSKLAGERVSLEQKMFNRGDTLGSQVLTKNRGASLVSDWLADGLPWVLYGSFANKPYSLYRPVASDMFSDWFWNSPAYAADVSVASFEELGDYDADGLLDLVRYEDATSTHPLPWYASMAHFYFSTRTDEGDIVPFGRDGGQHPPAARAWMGDTLLRTLADVNGDSMPDVVAVPKPGTTLPGAFQGILVFPGDGTGTFSCLAHRGLPCLSDIPGSPYAYDFPYRLEGGPTFAELGAAVRVHVHDVTGDGLADVVLETTDKIHVWINQDGLTLARGPSEDHPAAHDGGVASANLVFADTNASGNDDLVVVTRTKIHAWDLFRTSPGFLESLANGLGATTSFLYERVANLDLASQGTHDPWTTHLPVPMHVVTDVRTFNSAPEPAHRARHRSYAYRNPAYDGWNKQFLGFGSVTETVEGDDSAPSTETTTRYRFSRCAQAKDHVCDPRARALDPTRAYSGFPVDTLVSDGKGTPLSKTHVTIEPIDVLMGMDGRIVRFAHARQTDTWLYDTSKGPAAWTDFEAKDVTDPVDDVPGGRPDTKRPLPTPENVTLKIPKDAVHLRTISRRDAFGHVVQSTDFGRIEGGPVDRPIVQKTDWAQVVPQGGWQWRVRLSILRAFDTRITALNHENDRVTLYEFDADGNVRDVFADLHGSLPLERHHDDASRATAPLPLSASTDGRVRLAHFTYDPLTGLPVQVESPGNGCARTGYDEAFGALPTTHTVFTGGCDRNPITTTTVYDRGLELVTMTVAPSGATATSEFDGFGRLLRAFDPDPETGMSSTEPSLTREYIQKYPLVLVHEQVRDTRGYHEAYRYVDSLGETLLSLSEADRTRGDAGAWIASGLSLVSAKGLVTRAFDPWFYNGNPESVPFAIDLSRPSHAATFDAFGRVTQTLGYDQKPTSKHVYHALSQELWDASDLDPQSPHKDTPTTRAYDGHGRLETVIETGKIGQSAAVSTVTTAFEYQSSGELVRLSRTAGNLSFSRSMRFDTLGRRVETLEPNTSTPAGTSQVGFRYAYDDRGLLVGTSDARGCGKNLFYDGAGRLLAEDVSPCTSSQSAYSPIDLATGHGSEAFYRYDASDTDLAGTTHGLYAGRLTATFDRGAHTQILLDARGRTREVLRRIAKPGEPSADLASRYAPHVYRQDYGFDEAGRLQRKTTGVDVEGLMGSDPSHPSEVTFGYSDRGVLTEIGSSYGTLLTSASFGPEGRPQGETYGDVHAPFTTSYTYDPQTQKLTNYQLSRGPRALEDFTYRYDGSLLKAIDDHRSKGEWADGAKPVSRTFDYDDFYRLTSIAYDSGGDTEFSTFAQDHTLRAAFPPHRFLSRVARQTFDFDALGNLTKTSDDAQDGFFDRSLGALKHDPSSPNRLTGDTAGKLAASYDNAGNLTGLAVTRSGECADPQGKCSHRFAYEWDEEGNLARARRWDAAGAPPAADDAPAVDLRYVYAGGARVVRETRTPEHRPVYAAWIFDSLRLDGAHFDGDYERTDLTESADLAGLGHVLVLPSDAEHGLSGTRRVFLRFADHLGSTSTVADYATGDLVSKTTYQAYGAVDSDYRAAKWGNVREDVRFTGKEDDLEVGLVYFGARYYAPALGRWLSPDPLTIHALGSDLNPYAYVSGQVTTLTDALGLCGGRPGVCCECGVPQGGTDQSGQPVVQIGSGTPSNGELHPVAKGVRWVWDNTVGAAIDSIGSLFGGGNNSAGKPPPPPVQGVYSPGIVVRTVQAVGCLLGCSEANGANEDAYGMDAPRSVSYASQGVQAAAMASPLPIGTRTALGVLAAEARVGLGTAAQALKQGAPALLADTRGAFVLKLPGAVAEGVAARLGQFGINATEFGAGKLVTFEQPGLIGFAQLQGNRLIAGIFSIKATGNGLRMLAQFRGQASALGRELGATELELVGAEFYNESFKAMLIRQGFVEGTMAAPEALGGGTMSIVSKVFGL